MISEIGIVSVLTVLLYGLPVLFHGLKQSLFQNFKFKTLTNSFNKALIPQILIALIIGILAYVIDKTVYANGHGNLFTSVIVGTAVTYIIIGGFFYIPGLILLNIVNWIINLIRKKKPTPNST